MGWSQRMRPEETNISHKHQKCLVSWIDFGRVKAIENLNQCSALGVHTHASSLIYALKIDEKWHSNHSTWLNSCFKRKLRVPSARKAMLLKGNMENWWLKFGLTSHRAHWVFVCTNQAGKPEKSWEERPHICECRLNSDEKFDAKPGGGWIIKKTISSIKWSENGETGKIGKSHNEVLTARQGKSKPFIAI